MPVEVPRAAETCGQVFVNDEGRDANYEVELRAARRPALWACLWGRDASRASSATARKLRNVGSGQWTSARPFANQDGSTRKTMPVITTLPSQPTTRNNVASTIPQKPSSAGRPRARNR